MARIAEDPPLEHEEGRVSLSRATPPGQVDTLSIEGRLLAREAYRNYHRWLRLKRLALVGFFVMAALFLVWVVPWLPNGLETDDYTPELGFTAYLLVGVALTAVLALAFEEFTRRQRDRLMVWGTVYDEATGLHSRSYLYDRLSLECGRARHRGRVFSLLVLQLRVGGSAREPVPILSTASLQKMAELMNQLTHRTDLVALLSGSELAILALDVDKAVRGTLLERLRAAVEAELPSFLDRPALVQVIGGAATYGVEGTEAGALVQAARTAAALGLPRRGQAA